VDHLKDQFQDWPTVTFVSYLLLSLATLYFRASVDINDKRFERSITSVIRR